MELVPERVFSLNFNVPLDIAHEDEAEHHEDDFPHDHELMHE